MFLRDQNRECRGEKSSELDKKEHEKQLITTDLSLKEQSFTNSSKNSMTGLRNRKDKGSPKGNGDP